MLPYISMCSNADDTMSGGGCVGLGKFLGSYFWYVWITPPRGFLSAMEICAFAGIPRSRLARAMPR